MVVGVDVVVVLCVIVVVVVVGRVVWEVVVDTTLVLTFFRENKSHARVLLMLWGYEYEVKAHVLSTHAQLSEACSIMCVIVPRQQPWQCQPHQ